MRRFLIRTLDLLMWLAILASVAGGILAGGKFDPVTRTISETFNPVGAAVGGLSAFVGAVILFGALAVLLQIEENTRRNAQVFDALVKRAQDRLDQPS